MSKAPAGVSAKWTPPASTRRWTARELRPVTATASSAGTSGPAYDSHGGAGTVTDFLTVTTRLVSTTISTLRFLFTAPLKYFGAGRAKPGLVPARAPYGVILSQVGSP